MQEPDLAKMWKTWIKIQSANQPTNKMFQDAIRQKMQPILQLQKSGKIDWFYFLWHTEGAPDPANLYFDVIFTTEREDPNEFLPEYCIGTEKISPMIAISGIDEKILSGQDIRKAWRIIGEQSEFMINLVCSHQENIEIPSGQIAQFMHYFMNPLGYGHRCWFFPEEDPVFLSGGRWLRF